MCGMYVSGMQLRSVDLTNFIYITDASMQYIGRITTYVFCLSEFVLCSIYVPKIIKAGENLTKFWQKQFGTVFFFWGGDTVYMSAGTLSQLSGLDIAIASMYF